MVVRGQRLGEGRKSVKTKVRTWRRRVRSTNTVMMMRTMFSGERQSGLSSSARPLLTPRLRVRAPPTHLSVISLPSSSLQTGRQTVPSGEQIRKVINTPPLSLSLSLFLSFSLPINILFYWDVGVVWSTLPPKYQYELYIVLHYVHCDMPWSYSSRYQCQFTKTQPILRPSTT